MITRTRISADDNGLVTLEYAHAMDESWIERQFSCPTNGGYVIEHTRTGTRQVCDGLSTRGNTLHCSSRDALLDMIRREYRAMRRNEKRARA